MVHTITFFDFYILVLICCLLGVFLFLNSRFQVDVLCVYKETESLVEELTKMKIPDYKPTSNHVHLSDKGLSTSVSLIQSLSSFQPVNNLFVVFLWNH